jgi:hypothetical protein
MSNRLGNPQSRPHSLAELKPPLDVEDGGAL